MGHGTGDSLKEGEGECETVEGVVGWEYVCECVCVSNEDRKKKGVTLASVLLPIIRQASHQPSRGLSAL